MGVIINPRTANPFGVGAGVLLKENMTADTHTGAEAIHQFCLIPAGMFPIGGRLRMRWAGGKNGASNAASFDVRMGTLNTTGDTKLTATSITLTSANRSLSTMIELIRYDAGNVRTRTNGSQLPSGQVAAASIADVSVGGLDDAFYLSLSCALTSEIYTSRYFSVEIF